MNLKKMVSSNEEKSDKIWISSFPKGMISIYVWNISQDTGNTDEQWINLFKFLKPLDRTLYIIS